MKRFVPINRDGNIEVSPDQLHDMLEESYQDGYVQGKIDAIMNTVPRFDHVESNNKAILREGDHLLIFRATMKQKE